MEKDLLKKYVPLKKQLQKTLKIISVIEDKSREYIELFKVNRKLNMQKIVNLSLSDFSYFHAFSR